MDFEYISSAAEFEAALARADEIDDELQLGGMVIAEYRRLPLAKLAAFRKVTSLTIQDIALAALPEALAEMTSLQHLSLMRTPKLDWAQAFSVLVTMRRLRSLEIRHQKKLEVLDPQIAKMTFLETLGFNAIPFRAFPDAVLGLTTLQELIFNDSWFKELPPAVSRLEGLRRLVFFGGSLASLPPEVCALENLYDLTVHSNRLGGLPQGIGGLRNLEVLELQQNELKALPASLFELPKLRRLDLWSNKLRELPPAIGRLKALRDLRLDDNPLKTLPPELGDVQLETLGLTKTPLLDRESIPASLLSVSVLDDAEEAPRRARPAKEAAPAAKPATWYLEHQREDARTSGGPNEPLPEPRVLCNSKGTVSLVWASSKGIEHRFFDGRAWHDEIIATGTTACVRAAYGPDDELHLVFDRGGTCHSGTYRYEGRGQLVHAVRKDAWSETIIADNLWKDWEGPGNPRLALGPDGSPHVVFDDTGIVHAHRVGASWKCEGLALRGVTRGNLVVDEQGLHMLLVDEHVLYYATEGRETWAKEKLGDKYDTEHPSLARDGEGNLHVVYMAAKQTNDRATYVTRGPRGWSEPEMLPAKGNSGFGCAVAVDSRGAPHVVFRIQKSRDNASAARLEPAQVVYAKKSGDGWVSTTVVERAGWGCDLAMGPDDTPWVAYLVDLKGGLGLANPARATLGTRL